MMKDKTSLNHMLVIVLLYSGITGIITGLFLYLFRYLSSLLLELTYSIYSSVQSNLWYLPFFVIGLVVLAYLVSLLIKWEPHAGGGAISRAAGFVRGILLFNWLKTLISTFISAQLVFFAGLPFGIEGPSVIMGTAISGGVDDLGKAHPAHRKYLLTAGASAGFSIATGSIFAGTIFTLEEMHKKFSFMLLSVAMSGAVFASVTMRILDYVLGNHAAFFSLTNEFKNIPFEFIWLAPLLGIGAGLLAAGFNFLIDFFGHMSTYKFKKVPLFVKLTINFLLVGFVGLFVIETIGNGHHSIIEPLFDRQFSFGMIVLLIVLKIITIVVSSSSGTTGGLFIPVLVIGALYAGIFNEVSILIGLNSEYTAAIVLIGMSVFFSTSMQAPITTIAFIIEASLHPETIIFMMVAILAGILIAELLHMKPLNEIALKRFMKIQDQNRVWNLYNVKATIQENAFVIGKTVRDILWPANTLIKELIQENQQNATNIAVHGGDRVLTYSDQILFQIQSFDIERTLKEVQDLIGIQEVEIELIR